MGQGFYYEIDALMNPTGDTITHKKTVVAKTFLLSNLAIFSSIVACLVDVVLGQKVWKFHL